MSGCCPEDLGLIPGKMKDVCPLYRVPKLSVGPTRPRDKGTEREAEPSRSCSADLKMHGAVPPFPYTAYRGG
jgi:hypothetical protein